MKDSVHLWVQELRSGRWAQSSGSLRTEEGWCCLGVACEIAIQEGVPIRKRDARPDETGDETGEVALYGSEGHWQAAFLPMEVRLWLGLHTENGTYWDDDDDGKGRTVRSLSSMNDQGTTFAQIADIIESRPDGLFREEDEE